MSLQYFLPQRFSSWCLRKLTRIKTPWFKNFFIRTFARIYKINWQESRLKNPEEFAHFNAFFTRELTPGARSISESPLVSPADGKIAALGSLQKNRFIEAKGHHFSLESLIADPQLAEEFHNGQFVTVYLSPRDYHRIHMPVTGTLLKTIHIPGKLYSVSLKTAEQIPTLFAQNERLVSVFDSDQGKIIIILVGAINVSSMETVWDGLVTPPYGEILNYRSYQDKNIQLQKGEELGRFNMGSTVIVLTENQTLKLDSALKESASIQLGDALFR